MSNKQSIFNRQIETLRVTVHRALSLDSRYFELLFVLVMAMFVFIQLWMSRDYSDETVLVPYIIGIPTLALLIILAVCTVSTRMESLLNTIGDSEFSISGNDDDSGQDFGIDDSEHEQRLDAVVARLRFLKILFWIVGLLSGIYFFGFFTGSLLFMLVFTRNETEVTNKKVVLYAISIWILLLLLFEVVIGAPLYRGYYKVDAYLLYYLLPFL